MKKDRELIQMASAGQAVDEIAGSLDLSPGWVMKAAKRLGVKIEASAKRDCRLKAKKP